MSRTGFCISSFLYSRRFYYRVTYIIFVVLCILWLCNLWISSTLTYSEFFIIRKTNRSIHSGMRKSLQNLMAQPKFDFLPNYKNPCFIRKTATRGVNTDTIDGNWKGLYNDSIHIITYDPGLRQNQGIKLSREKEHIPVGIKTHQNEYPVISKEKVSGRRLFCLPYFIIAGFPKCGTTDLWHRMIQHPDIVVHPTEKEPMFFDNRRFCKYFYI
ncbi:hypothetical protein CHS0354_005505 [Potamilus streckersoni]|uniref:Sulfotransferase n=1 Tax=Potamilus streckersoni TaxID=2493646 RepID=A0AAE0W1W4_9BIVA|nr:hypothetical protein CHS0354_005505 [Potamilus streckersoni]